MGERTMVSNVIRAIITIAVIIIVLTIFFLAYQKLYAEFKEKELSEEEKQKTESNFDLFVANIERCLSYAESECLCEVFPNWPGTFAKDIVIEIEEKNNEASIKVVYKGKTIKNKTIKKLRLSAIFTNRVKVKYKKEKQIDYRVEPPYYIQEDITKGLHIDKQVISPYVYKTKEALYFIIGDKRSNVKGIEALRKCKK